MSESIRKNKKESGELMMREEWIPSPAERLAFKNMMSSFISWIDEKMYPSTDGKGIKVPAHFGYTEGLEGREKAMQMFGAVSLINHAGKMRVGVRILESFNDFIKTGHRIHLFDKFNVIEKIYFKSRFGEQKQMEFYQNNVEESQ